MVLYERGMNELRVYDGTTMKLEADINCKNVILSVEFIVDKNAICVSLSDRTFLFFDATPKPVNKNDKKTTTSNMTPLAEYKCIRKFALKFIQKNLFYVKRKKILFSA